MSMADYWIGHMSLSMNIRYQMMILKWRAHEHIGVQCIENGEYPCLESGTYDKNRLRVGRSEMELCRKNVKRQ